MKTKTKLKVVGSLLVIFVALPIWFYLLYTLLKFAQVDRLVWFLFYVYILTQILFAIISEVAKAGD